jgi:hypothetical protein
LEEKRERIRKAKEEQEKQRQVLIPLHFTVKIVSPLHSLFLELMGKISFKI